MAVAFPTGLNLCTGTVLEEDDGVVIDKTDDGAMAVRQLYSTTYYMIDAVWNALPRDKHNTLRSFLSSNRTSELTLTVDDATYTVRQIAPLKTPYQHGNGMVTASCRFRGTKNA